MGLNLAAITRGPQCYCSAVIPLCPSTCTQVWACAMKETHIEDLVLNQDSTRSKCLWSNYAPRSPTYPLMSLLKGQIMHWHTDCGTQLCMQHWDFSLFNYLSISLAQSLIGARSNEHVPGFKQQWFDISFRTSLFITWSCSLCGLCSLRSANQLSSRLTLQTSVPLLSLSLLDFPLDGLGSFPYFIAVPPYASKPQCLYVH